jgi:hypothetical protein
MGNTMIVTKATPPIQRTTTTTWSAVRNDINVSEFIVHSFMDGSPESRVKQEHQKLRRGEVKQISTSHLLNF